MEGPPDARADGVDVLDPEACLALLRTVALGRIAWSDADGRVQVRPVTFGLDGGCVAFRCGPGSMLDAIREGRPVGFEADRIEPALRSGWSVLLVGATAELDTASAGHPGSRIVDPWAGGERPHLVRLRAGELSGRRLRLAAGGVSVVRVGPDDAAG